MGIVNNPRGLLWVPAVTTSVRADFRRQPRILVGMFCDPRGFLWVPATLTGVREYSRGTLWELYKIAVGACGSPIFPWVPVANFSGIP